MAKTTQKTTRRTAPAAPAKRGKASLQGTRGGRTVKVSMEAEEFMQQLGAGIAAGVNEPLTAIRATLADLATRVEQLAQHLELPDRGK